jgi:hypothetical protein
MSLVLVALGGPAQGQDSTKVDPVMTAAVQVTRNPDPARAHATPVLARNP